MLKVLQIHPWDVDYKTALRIQNELRSRVLSEGEVGNVRLVAGADVSYSKNTDRVYATVLMYDLENRQTVEMATASGPSPFPYVPGLLSFRESPILLEAFRRISSPPDVVMLDGQGVAHPRRLGLASHVGLLLDLPTIGCAKSKLVGSYEDPGPMRGDRSPLLDGEERIGVVLRTKQNVKPVFVSIGHRIGLECATEIVLRSCTGYRLPEPTRRAHVLVNQLRRREEKFD